jgi:tRNA A-37 threonylcarbamoyl transferase component Bud32
MNRPCGGTFFSRIIDVIVPRRHQQRFRRNDFGTSSISIPYYAPLTDLPTTLPTIPEIENAREILRERSIVTTVAINSHFVVKYGEGVNLGEGQMMIFMRQWTNIPVARVFALFRCDTGKNFIVMERIDGTTLEELWHTLDDEKKTEIITKLKRHLRQMRTIESPGGYCNLDNKPLLNEIFWTPSLDCVGPFDTEAELCDALVRKCRQSEALKQKSEYYRDILPVVLRGHKPVLTHGDLQRKNIMVRRGTDSDIVLLDWEFAGWYPCYWEYAATVFAGWFTDDWYRWIPKFLEPFPNEYAWYAMLAQEIGY